MSTPEEFAGACKDTARLLRRLPAELRRTLGQRARAEVAEPLAAAIRADWSGPHAAVLSAATKSRVSANPQVVIGGARRVVSGGANARQLVYGNEFGGGKRVGRIPARAGQRAHTRATTNQFPRLGQSAVFGTIQSTLDTTFARWADIVDDVLTELED